MAATIIDVAKKCGYSKATVARAYSSPQSVSERAREKIYAAAKELHYAPNAIARAMVRRRTENIAFIIHEKQYPAILNPFYSPILEAAMQEATKRNYSIFITTSQDMRLPNGEMYIEKNMDGVIFAGEVTSGSVCEFQKQNIPVVLLNNGSEAEKLSSVTIDHFHGAEIAVEHLCDRGHRRIGLLAGRFSPYVFEARLEGYLSVLDRHGLPKDSRFIADLDPTLADGERAMAAMLGQPDCPTAFFCTNDTIAAGAVKAVLRAGLRVPEDIAIVGFDDSYISQVIEPELTTVRVDTQAMGRVAAQKLFDMIDGKDVSEKHVEIPTELVIRGTT